MPFVDAYDIPEKPWGTETVLAHTDLYTLKKLTYEAGHQGALQKHERKDEAFHLHEGAGLVTWECDGRLRTRYMKPGETFHVPPGTAHKFEAILRCVVFEASNPVFNDRINCAAEWGDEDGQAR